MQRFLRFYVAMSAIACASCTSLPRDHFYTLNTDIPSSVTAPSSLSSSAEKQAVLPAKAAANFYVEVNPVQLPAQVDRPQFVITTAPGRVMIREQQRWSAPLQDEIRQLLAETLMDELTTLDVAQTPVAKDLPIYRVNLKVQRFISKMPAPAHTSASGSATLSALWNIRLISANSAQHGATLTCQSFFSEAVKPTYDALVLGHRRALQHVAQQIASAIRSMAAAATPQATNAIRCSEISHHLQNRD